MSNFKDYEQGVESSGIEENIESLKEEQIQNSSPTVISGSLVIYPSDSTFT